MTGLDRYSHFCCIHFCLRGREDHTPIIDMVLTMKDILQLNFKATEESELSLLGDDKYFNQSNVFSCTENTKILGP